MISLPNSFSCIDKVGVRIKPMTPIEDIAEDAIKLAKMFRCNVIFNFNGEEITVTERATPQSIIEHYHRKNKSGSRYP